jgi:hypothetical protein
MNTCPWFSTGPNTYKSQCLKVPFVTLLPKSGEPCCGCSRPVEHTVERRMHTLREWSLREFVRELHPMTLRRYACEGQIVPQPVKRGREWLVGQDARFISAAAGRGRTVKRAGVMGV